LTYLLRISSLALLLLLGSCAGNQRLQSERFIYSPYKHVNQFIGRDAPVISGSAGPYADLPRAGALTWAFATGECGRETWGGIDADLFARANVPTFQRAGVGYVVSTGGEGGLFTCATEAGMELFIRRYASPLLRGLDFDIEGQQTPQQIDELVQSLHAVRGRYPRLYFSFTLATHAAADGSRRSLNPLGETVLSAIRKVGLENFRLNLMVMNYGPPQSMYCFTRGDACDMGHSAIQAVENVHLRYGVPYRQIEVTAMLGENDVAANVFTVSDADMLARFALERGLAGLHYWSLDRDAPCPPGVPRVSATCSGVSAATGAFARAFAGALR